MNCRDVHTYFEEREVAPELSWDTEIAQHISSCESCRRSLEIRKDIRAGLYLLRSTTPSVSESLDTSVIANYREAMATGPVASTRPQWTSTNRYWRLGIAAAVAMVVIAAVLVVRRPQNPTVHNHADLPTAAVAQANPPAPVKPKPPVSRKKNAFVAKVVAPQPHASGNENPPAVAAAFRADDSQEFRSLMYCDELSCNGGMELVRIQLPALPAGLLPTAAGARPVSADVLVGADGFARGIRIVH